MNYKVIIFNNAEEIEKALNEAYKEGYNAGYDNCLNEADDFLTSEDAEAEEELRKKHEAELDDVGHRAYEEGKIAGYDYGFDDDYKKGFAQARVRYAGLNHCDADESGEIPFAIDCSSEHKCTDAVSHINI